jgi:RNA-binding protein Musashi
MHQKLPSKLIFSSNHPQTTKQKLRYFPSLSIAVMNNYQAAAAQGYGPPTSPHATNTRTGFPAANSPGPTIDMYSSNGGDSVSYVQATSPQPSGFPAIAVSRAPLNYSPVSIANKFPRNFLRKSSP